MDEQHYLDPVEWSELLDEVAAELEGANGNPPAGYLATTVKTQFIGVIRSGVSNVDVLCTPQILVLVERYFPPRAIVELFVAGWLFALRKSQTALHRYPTIQRLASVADYACLEELKKEITETVKSPGSFEETRIKIIKAILARVKYGMDINALGTNGLGLLHELMRMDIPDELFCAEERDFLDAEKISKYNPWGYVEGYCSLLDFLSSRYCFELDWSLRDVNGNTVLHYAVDCKKSEAVQRAFYRSGRCYRGALNNEGYLAFAQKELSLSEKDELGRSYAISDVDLYVWDFHISTVVRWSHLEQGYFRTEWLRCQLGNIFSTIERALPDIDFVSLLELSYPDYNFLTVILPLLNVGNWDLLTRYPKMLGAFFEVELHDNYLAFLIRLSQECVERRVDTQGKAEHVLDVYKAQLNPPRRILSIHDACALTDYDLVVALVKQGADVFAENKDGRLPLQVLCSDPAKEKERERLRLFLEHRMGMTFAQYRVLRESGLLCYVPAEAFSRLDTARRICLFKASKQELQNLAEVGIKDVLLTWPIVLVQALLNNSAGPRRLINGSGMYFRDLYNLDPRADKPLLRRWLQMPVCKKIFQEIAELDAFKDAAFAVSCSRKSHNGSGEAFVFFKSAPRDVVCRVVAHASPNFLTIDEGHLFAEKMLPKSQHKKANSDQVRQELLEKLRELFWSAPNLGKGEIFIISLMAEALDDELNAENIELVEAYRKYFETCKDEQFSELFKSCLEVVDADKETLQVTRPLRK